MHAVLVAALNEATPRMCELLHRARSVLATADRPEPMRRGLARERAFEVRGGRSHVFGLDTAGRELQEVVFDGLHVSHSRLITDLRRARFADSLIEASDLTYADLRGTLWQRTRVRNCFLREASFMDAGFDDTMFIDCDLRGADFTMDSLDLSTSPGITFIRCDLRDAGWRGRDLSGFERIDCRIFDPVGRLGDAARDHHSVAHCTGGRRREPGGEGEVVA